MGNAHFPARRRVRSHHTARRWFDRAFHDRAGDVATRRDGRATPVRGAHRLRRRKRGPPSVRASVDRAEQHDPLAMGKRVRRRPLRRWRSSGARAVIARAAADSGRPRRARRRARRGRRRRRWHLLHDGSHASTGAPVVPSPPQPTTTSANAPRGGRVLAKQSVRRAGAEQNAKKFRAGERGIRNRGGADRPSSIRADFGTNHGDVMVLPSAPDTAPGEPSDDSRTIPANPRWRPLPPWREAVGGTRAPRSAPCRRSGGARTSSHFSWCVVRRGPWQGCRYLSA